MSGEAASAVPDLSEASWHDATLAALAHALRAWHAGSPTEATAAVRAAVARLRTVRGAGAVTTLLLRCVRVSLVIGDQRKFLACLVMLDPETVSQFAQEHSVPFTDFTSLCRAKEVQDLIWGEIERVNRQLARVETIKTFRLIEQILTPEDEELTPTMKLKRSFVNRKYKDVIDDMYERSER